ncbi:MAG: M28 family peptidase, partial [Candidatus Promineifilaceae bacterium]
RSPPEAFNLAASPTALLPNGDVIAEVTATFRLPGSSDEVFHSTGLFRAVNDELRWAGPLRDSVSGERITVRFPEDYDFLGSSLLQDAEALYASLSAQIGIEDPEPIQIELLDGDEEFRTTVALSSPASGWIRGYSQAGTPTRLRLYPVSNAADYRSELAVQLARQLLNQRGVQSEWLLKGVSAYLSRPLDGGDYQQASAAALPDLVEAVQEGSTYRFDDFPDDAHLTQSRFELARVQAWDAVRYLIETYGYENLERLLELNGSGEELESAASSALGVSLSDFSEEWATSFSEGHLPDGALEISERFDSDAVEDHIDYLAGPNLEGRLAGTEGADIAAQYILDYFEEYELIPAGDISTASYLQTFSITTTDWVQEPYFEVNGDERPYLLREEMLFSRAAITGTDIISGELVWIGAPSSGAVDLSGKLMVAIAQDDVEQQIDEANSYGAEGLILLGIKDEIDELYEKKPLGSDSIAAIPVLELSKNGTLRFLEYWGRTYMELSELDPVLPMELTASMGAKVEEPRMAPTANVLGVIPGSDPYLSQEYIVVGAHYDHVGDDPASFDCSPAEGNSELICEEAPGERYSGRNDDASGVAAMLELLRIWREAGYQPKRSILFAGWGAQEFGQLGSGHFVLSPTISLSQISAMVQLDGIGGGGGFNPGFQANRSTDMLPLHYAQMAAGYLDENTTETTLNAESDHFTFSEMGLPVLLLNWRLADENNLPDSYADGVSLERVESVGKIAALTLMMLAQ